MFSDTDPSTMCVTISGRRRSRAAEIGNALARGRDRLAVAAHQLGAHATGRVVADLPDRCAARLGAVLVDADVHQLVAADQLLPEAGDVGVLAAPTLGSPQTERECRARSAAVRCSWLSSDEARNARGAEPYSTPDESTISEHGYVRLRA
jgi:hypothetical protein